MLLGGETVKLPPVILKVDAPLGTIVKISLAQIEPEFTVMVGNGFTETVALLNMVLAALERIRGAADDALAGGVALIGELNTTPDLLAKTDEVIKEVANGAVRYAGPVSKLLG